MEAREANFIRPLRPGGPVMNNVLEACEATKF